MFKIHIASQYNPGRVEGYSYYDCVVMMLGGYPVIKAGAEGTYDWNCTGLGKYAQKLTVICLAIASDINALIRRIPAAEMQEIIKIARKDGRAILPIDTNVYFDPYEVNCDSYIFLDWIDDSDFPDARRPAKRHR